MASEIQIGGEDEDRIFLGTDGNRKFHVKDIDADSTGATAKQITGKVLKIDIRRQHKSSDSLLLATLAIAGTFNSVAATNAERATWTYLDTELTTAVFGTNGGTFAYSVKDLTDGAEVVLQWGDIVIERVTQI